MTFPIFLLINESFALTPAVFKPVHFFVYCFQLFHLNLLFQMDIDYDPNSAESSTLKKKRKRNSSTGSISQSNPAVVAASQDDISAKETSGSSKGHLTKKVRKSNGKDPKMESRKSTSKSSKGNESSLSTRNNDDDDVPMQMTPAKTERVLPAKDVSKIKKKRSYEARLRRRKRVKDSIKLKKKQNNQSVTTSDA